MRKPLFTYLYWCFYVGVWNKQEGTGHQRAAILFSVLQLYVTVILGAWMYLLSRDQVSWPQVTDVRPLGLLYMGLLMWLNYRAFARGGRYLEIYKFYKKKGYSEAKGRVLAFTLLGLGFAFMVFSLIMVSKVINGW